MAQGTLQQLLTSVPGPHLAALLQRQAVSASPLQTVLLVEADSGTPFGHLLFTHQTWRVATALATEL